MKIFCVALILTAVSPSVLSEIVKWTDDTGKVHFGDRVPEKYRKIAKRFISTPQILLKMSILHLGNRSSACKKNHLKTTSPFGG